MGKISIIFILILNLYCEERYFLEYLKNEKIKTEEITKDKFLEVSKNLEYYKNREDKKVVWTYGNDKDYEIVKIYKEEENKNKEIETDTEGYKQSSNTEENKEDIKEKKSYLLEIIITILILTILYKRRKNKNKQNTEIKVENSMTEKELENENLFIEKEEITEENQKEIFSYEEIEKIRVETYKKLKYIKTIEKEKKIELYTKIKEIKEEIKNKNEITEINKKLNKIIKEVSNGTTQNSKN